MRNVGVFKYIISIVVVLLCITVAYGGDRRTVRTHENGDYGMLPAIGECDTGRCVITERYIVQWDGLKWIHQFVDIDGDGKCDRIRVWKPIADPSFGIFYTIYSTKSCEGSIH